MALSLMEESTLTSRYQTTVPAAVRRQLNLNKGDRITYQAEGSGRVYIEAASEPDPALAAFLDYLETDIARHPERIEPIGRPMVERMQELVGEIEIDLDARLPAEDE